MADTFVDPVTSQASGFVIEDKTSGLPVYYDATITHGGSFGWNTDKMAALRFARFVDGMNFVKKHLAFAVGQVQVVPLVRG